MKVFLNAQLIIRLQARRATILPATYPTLRQLVKKWVVLECHSDTIPIPLCKYILAEPTEDGNYLVHATRSNLNYLDKLAYEKGLA